MYKDIIYARVARLADIIEFVRAQFLTQISFRLRKSSKF